MKKTTTVAIFFTLIIFFIVNACKKDNCAIPCNICEEIPIENPRRSIKNKADQEKSPCFNPNDGNEFVYIKHQGKKNSLMKYNLVEQKVSIILTDIPTIASQPQWGKNGWIVFTTVSDHQLNIVKSDGTEFKKITNGEGGFIDPVWKNDSIITAELTYSGGLPYFYSEIDLNGNLIDTIGQIGFDSGALNSKLESAYLKYHSSFNISVRDVTKITELVHTAVSGKVGKSVADIAWHPNDDDIFYTRFFYGISKINRNTMVDARFIVGCETRQYKDISISPDGKKIIVERVDASDYKGTDTITEDAGIYIMDIDGKNERKIEL